MDLTEHDRWLILATDGMWNLTKRSEMPALITGDTDDSFKLASG